MKLVPERAYRLGIPDPEAPERLIEAVLVFAGVLTFPDGWAIFRYGLGREVALPRKFVMKEA